MGDPGGATGPEEEPLARLLCDVTALTDAPASAGVLWKLTEPGRQLDANVVHLPPGGRVDTHVEPELDVLLLVVTGDGTVTGPDGDTPLTAGALLWLPRGSRRALAAGERGLSYVTVHRRRPGMTIRSRAT
ncbi:cupin domain-containing protein [Streptomyces sp. KAU_LT]|uniref:cupin domain-containing protein n=1 Tax=Streptomyces sp. KAU_LT TaxID=3046669 RepID=UPI0024B6CDED|nr:cupin domain-containing protein [Streptomyces sp. KAU_LT]MDI9835290.1 cupin domain-containing protein [Streptomyces sp. KAU_LT]